MSVVSLILFVVAAVIFLLVPSRPATTPASPGWWTRWSAVRLGLFVLTLAFMAQFFFDSRPIHG